MNIQIVFYFSMLFLVSELGLMLTKRSKNTETKTKRDKKSLLIFWILIPLSISTAFILAKYDNWDKNNQIIALIGLSLFISGMIIRWVAIKQLDKDFTVDVSILDAHQLKTNGLYSVVRHPSYVGLLLSGTGLGIALNSWLSCCIICITFVIAIVYRIKIEEKLLIESFGQAYHDYKQKTKALFPF